MKKSLLLILVALVSLFFVVPNNKEVKAADLTFEKITSLDQLENGKYLIVYESGKLCLDSSLSSIDAEGNHTAVTISNSQITSDEKYAFEISAVSDGYTIKSSSGYYIGQTSNANGLKSNKTTQYTNTISFATNGTVDIISGGAYLRFNNATTNGNRFRYYKSSSYTNQQAITLYKEVISGGDSGTTPETPEVPTEPELTPVDNEVKALFAKYYDNISYTKETVLNINPLTAQEVKLYFHNSQDVRYRNTVYTKNGLTMTTSTDGITYGEESTYTNGTNCVNHTGFGGNWTVTQYKSVEDWFITLKDFKDSTLSGWTLDNNVYTYVLTPTTETEEHEMTRMAREFVAPMWLAPNANNWGYVTFTKLTVEEIESTLVMKLYVSEGNEGQLLEGSNLVFAEATITFDDGSRTIAEALAIGGKQAHNTYTTDKYTLTGTVTNVYNTQYGNFYLKDNNGNQICIFGLYSADGSTRYDAMSYKPVEGDVITVTGVLGTYNSTIQMKNGWLLSVTPHEHNYTEATCTTPATCTICNGTSGETLPHPDSEKDHICDVCDAQVGKHEDTTGDSLCDYCGEEISGGSEEPVVGSLATFNLGANGSASHNDGGEKTTYTETVGGITLKVTSGTKFYTGARDAKGNSCFKLGTSKATGSFTITVPENVTEVVIHVAGYKAASSTNIKINGTQFNVKSTSDSGTYTAITIDTTTNKTITFQTVTYRCMINTIEFNGYAQ